MNEVRYIISDTAKRLNIEPHVLRYWEDELELDIQRNELGHRYYTEEDIILLEEIKKFKDQGLQLKAIKMLLENELYNEKSVDRSDKVFSFNQLTKEENSNIAINREFNEKLVQFQNLMREIFVDSLKENNYLLSETVSENVIKQMDYLLRMKEEHEEERFKKLDDTIRQFQKTRQEIAASKENKFIKIFNKKSKNKGI